MDRKELYKQIKEFNLQDVVKQKYGTNYTRVSSDNLYKVIEESKVDKPIEPDSSATFRKDNNVEEENKEAKNKTGISKETFVLAKLVEVLKKKHILLPSEVTYINQ